MKSKFFIIATFCLSVQFASSKDDDLSSLSSACFSACYSITDETRSLSNRDHPNVITAAEVFFLPQLGDKVSDIDVTRSRIEEYTRWVHRKISCLEAHIAVSDTILSAPLFAVSRATTFVERLSFIDFIGAEFISLLSLSRILPIQYCENIFAPDKYVNSTLTMNFLYFSGFSIPSLARNIIMAKGRYTVDKYDNIINREIALKRLEYANFYLRALLASWQGIANDKIPKALQVFFQGSAPILYKAVEDVSKHSKGRLAGVAFYFNEHTASMIAGRKALTEGDDKNHHIERELIKRLLPASEHNGGYLFVYTALPPCNTDTIGCLSFYRQLAQHNPNLRTIVIFDHEYEDGSNYTSLTTANFTMVNRVKAAKAIEQAESRKSSIAKMALTLTRATSDQIVSALQKKDDETAVEILKKFEDSERGKRLSQKLLHKQVAAG